MTAPLSCDQLQQLLAQSLSPDASSRKSSEQTLTAAQSSPGHALVVLRLISEVNAPQSSPIRQSAAVHFKNLVKKGWHPDEDDAAAKAISHALTSQDRIMIKNNLVELMCTVPPQIQSQIGESIALIASSDFPKQWDHLLPNLIAKLNIASNVDWDVVSGVLLTANSIFKRFRYVQRSDELYADILYVLNLLQEPLTKLFSALVGILESAATGLKDKVNALNALRTTCRIFYSLNYQVSTFLYD